MNNISNNAVTEYQGKSATIYLIIVGVVALCIKTIGFSAEGSSSFDMFEGQVIITIIVAFLVVCYVLFYGYKGHPKLLIDNEKIIIDRLLIKHKIFLDQIKKGSFAKFVKGGWTYVGFNYNKNIVDKNPKKYNSHRKQNNDFDDKFVFIYKIDLDDLINKLNQKTKK